MTVVVTAYFARKIGLNIEYIVCGSVGCSSYSASTAGTTLNASTHNTHVPSERCLAQNARSGRQYLDPVLRPEQVPLVLLRVYGADEYYDYLLGPTFALSLLAALLALVETAFLHIIFIRRLEVGAGPPPVYTPHLDHMKFWGVFALGLVVVVPQPITLANSVLAAEDLGA